MPCHRIGDLSACVDCTHSLCAPHALAAELRAPMPGGATLVGCLGDRTYCKVLERDASTRAVPVRPAVRSSCFLRVTAGTEEIQKL